MTITAKQLVEAINSITPMRGMDDAWCDFESETVNIWDGSNPILESGGIGHASVYAIGCIVIECAKRGWTISTMSGGKRGVWIFGGHNINDSSHGVLGYSGGTDALAWCEAFRQAKEAADVR